jgi:hypothetical protein
MYGDLCQFLLGAIIAMSASSMIIPNLLDFIYCVKNLKFFNAFVTSRIWFNNNLIIKSSLCKPIGREYQALHSFFQRVGIAHHVSCPHVHQQNGLLSTSIATSLKWVYPCWLMHQCHLNFGMKLSL